MLRLLVPLKFKKIWFIYDLSLSHLLLMVEAHCFLAQKTTSSIFIWDAMYIQENKE